MYPSKDYNASNGEHRYLASKSYKRAYDPIICLFLPTII